jgi:hypothetical protein
MNYGLGFKLFLFACSIISQVSRRREADVLVTGNVLCQLSARRWEQRDSVRRNPALIPGVVAALARAELEEGLAASATHRSS